MNICLYGDIVVKNNLDSKTSLIVLKKASEAADERNIPVTFYITNKYSKAGKWSLVGSCDSLKDDFIRNPDKYVISIDE